MENYQISIFSFFSFIQYSAIISILAKANRNTGDDVVADKTWRLRHKDGREEEFIDIRRKVGNRVIRHYLISSLLEDGPKERIIASLRGPRNEFKDFAKFIIVQGQWEDEQVSILVESGVYENLRIVGTTSRWLAEQNPDAIIKIFTEITSNASEHHAYIIISEDSKLMGG